MTAKSYDQSRRRSPKVTFTLDPDNLAFLDKALELNPKYRTRSGMINALLDKQRKGK